MARQPGAIDPIERDFRCALERLQDGKPTNEKLVKLTSRRMLKITVSTVALEAGHSRTLIGHKRCKYPGVREKILALREERGEPRTAVEVIGKKREEIARLQRKLAVAHSEMAALVRRLDQLETAASRKIRHAERRVASSKATSNAVAGAAMIGDTRGKVIGFPKAESERDNDTN